jgi:hypothetical protein
MIKLQELWQELDLKTELFQACDEPTLDGGSLTFVKIVTAQITIRFAFGQNMINDHQ